MVGSAKIQLALDLMDVDLAMEILSGSIPYIDVVEVGTPLIKSVGVKAIARARQVSGNLPIIADMKTMDNGVMEVSAAIAQGADGVTIQAAAPSATVNEAYEYCIAAGKLCYIDSLGLKLPEFLTKIRSYSSCKPVLHVGVDQQRHGARPTELAVECMQYEMPNFCALAGGINSTNLVDLKRLSFVDTYIVGGAIVRDKNPIQRAKELHQMVNAGDC